MNVGEWVAAHKVATGVIVLGAGGAFLLLRKGAGASAGGGGSVGQIASLNASSSLQAAKIQAQQQDAAYSEQLQAAQIQASLVQNEQNRIAGVITSLVQQPVEIASAGVQETLQQQEMANELALAEAQIGLEAQGQKNGLSLALQQLNEPSQILSQEENNALLNAGIGMGGSIIQQILNSQGSPFVGGGMLPFNDGGNVGGSLFPVPLGDVGNAGGVPNDPFGVLVNGLMGRP